MVTTSAVHVKSLRNTRPSQQPCERYALLELKQRARARRNCLERVQASN
jgi:hypothetical protein